VIDARTDVHLTLVTAPDRRARRSSVCSCPACDMDPAFVALHKRIAERNARILYRGTDVKSYNDPKALPTRAA